MSDKRPSIVWLRQDLRIADNPALTAAVERGGPVIPLYILDDRTPGDWAIGGAGRWWLHHSLDKLSRALNALGSPLVLRRGEAGEVLDQVIADSGAEAVFWNRCYEPFRIRRDKEIKADLKAREITADSFPGALLREPWEVTTKGDKPFQVFTPHWKALSALGDPPAPLPAPPLPAPEALAPPKSLKSDDLAEWKLLPTKPDWAGGLRETWTPGEDGAQSRLGDFIDEALSAYSDKRNRPDVDGTSRISPHLHWGEITPRQVWHRLRHAMGEAPKLEKGGWSYLRELGWRDFSYNLLYHWPSFPDETWKENFKDFPWKADQAALKAWQAGRTGYPIVDAGMRQLWAIGWMHNRVRMIVGSFLIKDLLIAWQEGEAWFWDTLVDADLANNAASWQWVAGCGADAAPFFRIFNPVLQGEKFDPKGAYVRHWVPELRHLPDKYVHKPWEAPEDVLRQANLTLGRDYPKPIVDHKAARQRALDAFQKVKQG